VIIPITVAIIFGLFVPPLVLCAMQSVLLNVPFSLVGGIIALYFRNMVLACLRLSAVTLFGVAVASGFFTSLKLPAAWNWVRLGTSGCGRRQAQVRQSF
jgi:Cu/Ag efflux pump CusA